MNQRKYKLIPCKIFLEKSIYRYAVIFAGVGLSHAQTKKKSPNILFIMSDDHTAQAISAYGGMLASYMPTPNIGCIGREGVRMNNCFVTNSICTPSRACIITGQYSHKNGVYTLDYALGYHHPTVDVE